MRDLTAGVLTLSHHRVQLRDLVQVCCIHTSLTVARRVLGPLELLSVFIQMGQLRSAVHPASTQDLSV